MDKDKMEEVSDLYRKISQRLDSQKVECTKNTTSIMELNDAMINGLGLFNTILLNKEKDNIRIINKSNGYGKFTLRSVENKIPRVSRIIPFVNEVGETGIKICFAYGNNDPIGVIILNENFLNSNYGKLDDTIKSNAEMFRVMFDALKYFTYEYPGFSYYWDGSGNSKYNQHLDDGFISCDFNVTNPLLTRVSLCKLKDLELSRIITKSHGELFDYIEMYCNSIMSRTAIDIDSLNPFIKTVLGKYRLLYDDERLAL